ncbi:hypothetical protein D3C73_1490920 [compost metagenome]
MFGASGRRDWVQGFMLWDWPAGLYPLEDAAANDDYCMYGKSSAPVIKDFYTSQINR